MIDKGDAWLGQMRSLMRSRAPVKKVGAAAATPGQVWARRLDCIKAAPPSATPRSCATCCTLGCACQSSCQRWRSCGWTSASAPGHAQPAWRQHVNRAGSPALPPSFVPGPASMHLSVWACRREWEDGARKAIASKNTLGALIEAASSAAEMGADGSALAKSLKCACRATVPTAHSPQPSPGAPPLRLRAGPRWRRPRPGTSAQQSSWSAPALACQWSSSARSSRNWQGWCLRGMPPVRREWGKGAAQEAALRAVSTWMGAGLLCKMCGPLRAGVKLDRLALLTSMLSAASKWVQRAHDCLQAAQQQPQQAPRAARAEASGAEEAGDTQERQLSPAPASPAERGAAWTEGTPEPDDEPGRAARGGGSTARPDALAPASPSPHSREQSPAAQQPHLAPAAAKRKGGRQPKQRQSPEGAAPQMPQLAVIEALLEEYHTLAIHADEVTGEPAGWRAGATKSGGAGGPGQQARPAHRGWYSVCCRPARPASQGRDVAGGGAACSGAGLCHWCAPHTALSARVVLRLCTHGAVLRVCR